MKDSGQPIATGRPEHLMALMGAIASHDTSGARALLQRAPWLAQETLTAGATRQYHEPWFLGELQHHVYAGDGALHIAAAACSLDAAKALLALGAHVRAKNRRGAEPLHYAVDGRPDTKRWDGNRQRAMVEYLLEAGAEVHCTDKSGVSPLHRAIRARCAAAVAALLNAGADPRDANANGSTPLHLAVQNTGRPGTGSMPVMFQQREIIALLLKHGARVSDTNGKGRSVSDCIKDDWLFELFRNA